MKQLIVFLAMVILGVTMFRIIAGDRDSIYTKTAELWQNEVEISRTYP